MPVREKSAEQIFFIRFFSIELLCALRQWHQPAMINRISKKKWKEVFHGISKKRTAVKCA
ncbi:MAG: hypothetical protein B6D45_10385 [Ignavibacteriales bacterium UTCHB3]|nr:MAG: hypothetical protein B6D45_10385 [Ignavibacteriales bacterium UTCHB3]